MPSIGPMELIVVLVIALVILGPKKLPDAARSLGTGLRGFKDSLSGMTESKPAAIEAAELAEHVEHDAPRTSVAAA